jgi:Kae1-associated kinase Bud32
MKNQNQNPELIAQGAEAKIFKEYKFVIKNRVSKGYRHPELDKKLIKQRTKRETSILERAHKLGISPKPTLEGLDKIKMPFIDGKKLSQELENLNYKQVCKQIGNNIAKLHDNNIIHGDLTTSNMILTKDKKVVFIDFGLGFTSERFEDRAVDLHLIKQALEAKHFSIWKECWKIIQENYNSKDKTKTLAQLKKVESRGRYKHGS